MTRANTEQIKHTPWFAKAGAACSIVSLSRFVGPNVFALKGGGYGCLFTLTGLDEEGLTEAKRDSEDQQRRQELAAEMQQLQATQNVPGPEAAGAPPMTAAQRSAMYGDSPNAPSKTSNVSQIQAEAKQKALEKEKLHQEALNSDTVAIDFAHPTTATSAAGSPAARPTAVSGEREEMFPKAGSETMAASTPEAGEARRGGAVQTAPEQQPKLAGKSNPMAPYDFDSYQGQLYRVFEGTVLEGVVTNHIDGGLTGPILIMLTTDYYSHDHQQLLMPQGTRLIGTVQSVGNAQQRKTALDNSQSVLATAVIWG